MGKVLIDITMSLDGFIAGPNDGPENGLGDGGMVLHEWVFEGKTDADVQFLEDPLGTQGAVILGRRTFDIADGEWGENPPFGTEQVFVLTHRPHEPLKRGKVTFIFVADGMEDAMQQARAVAGNKDITLMGADVSQQYLKAGQVDEMEIHVANVLLGAGKPLFTNIGDQQIKLERIQVVATPTVTHLRYRVVK
jgi:dihydrofolate reductase